MKKITKIIIGITLGIWLCSGLTAFAQAALPRPDSLTGLTETQQAALIQKGGTATGGGYGVMVVIPFIAKFSIIFASIFAVISLVYGGVLYVSTFGNETQTGNAKKIITWSLIGLVLGMFSYAIVATIIKIKIG